jgi:CRP/FNR family transcriptional regulator, cyclic AMP receptor protein
MMIDRDRLWRPLNVDGGTLDTVGVDRPDQGTLLARLDEADRQALLNAGRPKHYRSGESIFVVGDPGRFVALIVQGRVKVFAPSGRGTETVLSLRGPGDLVGELSAIEDEPPPRMATVVALDAVVCRVVRAEEFRSLVADRPAVALELLRMIADRLRSSDRRRVEFGAYGTTRRVAHLLVDLAAEGTPSDTGVVLRNGLTQDDLAGMVGASRESVARALATLRELGLVSTGRRQVAVLDLAGMREFAG